MVPIRWLVLALLALTLAPIPSAAADASAAPISLAPVLGGLDAPTLVTNAGDGSGRLFVLERRGVIRVASGGQLAPDAFLDLTDLVHTDNSEQGLLALAFDPHYAQNGYLYVYFTAKNWDDT